MKKIKKFEMSLALMSLVFLGGASVSVAQAPPAPTVGGSTLQQRIDQRKAERGIALSPQDTQRISSTCVQVQAKLRQVQTDAVSVLDNRIKVYNRIDAKLWVGVGQLKLANQDTFQLEKQRTGFVDKTNAFVVLATNYKQTLDDAIVINCQADPTGFKPLLETSRIYYDQLRTQSADSRDYVVNTVKPTLTSFSSELLK